MRVRRAPTDLASLSVFSPARSFDEHMTGKYAVPDGKGGYTVQLEGNFWPGIQQGCPGAGPGGNAYDMPYPVIVPKRGTGVNLLVPVAFSASAVAYSSTRIESMFMYVGTAAGVAAKQVVDGSVLTVQDVNVTEVQRLLTEQFHQLIHMEAPVPPSEAPLYYNVTGAGSTTWNGQYKRSGDSQLAYDSTTCETCSLYQNSGAWRLAIRGKELMYVASSSTTLPPTSSNDWTVDNGTAPAPSLVAGPVRR